MRRWRAVTAALAVLAAACAGNDNDPPTGGLPAATRQPLVVEVRTETFVDPSRTTEAHNTVAASDSRSLTTRILAPAAGQPGRPYPLLVFAHGSGGLGTGYDVLLRGWAEAGYVVAAPATPWGA